MAHAGNWRDNNFRGTDRDFDPGQSYEWRGRSGRRSARWSEDDRDQADYRDEYRRDSAYARGEFGPPYGDRSYSGRSAMSTRDDNSWENDERGGGYAEYDRRYRPTSRDRSESSRFAHEEDYDSYGESLDRGRFTQNSRGGSQGLGRGGRNQPIRDYGRGMGAPGEWRGTYNLPETYSPAGGQSTMAAFGEGHAERFSESASGREGIGSNTGKGSGRFGTMRESFRGKGPKYSRSKESLEEEINRQLTEAHEVDAQNIEVEVQESGLVTLKGTVHDRREKRFAEDVVEEIWGVSNVRNELTVESSKQSGGSSTDRSDSSSSKTGKSHGGGNSKSSNSTSSASTRH